MIIEYCFGHIFHVGAFHAKMEGKERQMTNKQLVARVQILPVFKLSWHGTCTMIRMGLSGSLYARRLL